MSVKKQESAVAVVAGGHGPISVVVSPAGVARVLLGHSLPPCGSSALLRTAVARLRRYLAGRPVDFDLPLDLEAASAFDRSVWQVTQAIPRGELWSYGHVARHVGSPGAARAVGGALGRNPVPILVPCHRVVRTDGDLGGFGCGLDWKRFLLHCEGIEVD